LAKRLQVAKPLSHVSDWYFILSFTADINIHC
jgi:hypothetical protein